MIHAAAQGLADFEVVDSSPFILTPSGSVQPDPLAVRSIEDLSMWYQAAAFGHICTLTLQWYKIRFYGPYQTNRLNLRYI